MQEIPKNHIDALILIVLFKKIEFQQYNMIKNYVNYDRLKKHIENTHLGKPEFKLIDNETQKELDKEYWSYFCREY